jgi:hypothetical protein
MKISRRGATKDHGLASVEFTNPAITWVKTDSTIGIRQSNVKDFSTPAHHSYTVRITSQEITQVLEALATAALADPQAFEREFALSLRPLVQLTAVVSGLRK